MLAGPIDALADIAETDVSFNSETINRSYQNEGTNFCMGGNGKIAAAGNFRKTSDGGGVGVWASDNFSGTFKATIIAELTGITPEGEGEGHQQPDLAIDEATGNLYVVYYYDLDKLAYYAVKKGNAWSSPKRLLPEVGGTQGYFRSGPSVADIPGKGVVACVRRGTMVLMRTLDADASPILSRPSFSKSRPYGIQIMASSFGHLGARNLEGVPRDLSLLSVNGAIIAKTTIAPFGTMAWGSRVSEGMYILRISPIKNQKKTDAPSETRFIRLGAEIRRKIR